MRIRFNTETTVLTLIVIMITLGFLFSNNDKDYRPAALNMTKVTQLPASLRNGQLLSSPCMTLDKFGGTGHKVGATFVDASTGTHYTECSWRYDDGTAIMMKLFFDPGLKFYNDALRKETAASSDVRWALNGSYDGVASGFYIDGNVPDSPLYAAEVVTHDLYTAVIQGPDSNRHYQQYAGEFVDDVDNAIAAAQK